MASVHAQNAKAFSDFTLNLDCKGKAKEATLSIKGHFYTDNPFQRVNFNYDLAVEVTDYSAVSRYGVDHEDPNLSYLFTTTKADLILVGKSVSMWWQSSFKVGNVNSLTEECRYL